jgi:hypothetical protein
MRRFGGCATILTLQRLVACSVTLGILRWRAAVLEFFRSANHLSLSAPSQSLRTILAYIHRQIRKSALSSPPIVADHVIPIEHAFN